MDHRESEKYNVTIMIVDDTPENLRIMENILHGQGYTVSAFRRGPIALKSAANKKPDLILLDIMMPEMDGFAVCRNLKEDETTRDIPVIFISALDDPVDKIKAFATGGVDYITKPFYEDEVLARVKTHLSLRSMQLELEKNNRVFEEQLRWAGEMQKALLRPKLHSTLGVEFRVTYQPVPELYCGGDYYDVINLPNDRYLLLLGDVEGNGVKAAFITAILKAVIYPEYVRNVDILRFSPAFFLAWLNERMDFELRRTSGLQISFLVGVIDRESMTFTYANAGHNLPCLITRRGVQSLELKGPPIGSKGKYFYEEQVVKLRTGDVLFAYTSGLTRVEGNKSEEDNLMREILGITPQGKDFHRRILKTALSVSRRRTFEDDVTIITARLQ